MLRGQWKIDDTEADEDTSWVRREQRHWTGGPGAQAALGHVSFKRARLHLMHTRGQWLPGTQPQPKPLGGWSKDQEGCGECQLWWHLSWGWQPLWPLHFWPRQRCGQIVAGGQCADPGREFESGDMKQWRPSLVTMIYPAWWLGPVLPLTCREAGHRGLPAHRRGHPQGEVCDLRNCGGPFSKQRSPIWASGRWRSKIWKKKMDPVLRQRHCHPVYH